MGRVNGAATDHHDSGIAASEPLRGSDAPLPIGHGLRATAHRLLTFHEAFGIELQAALDDAGNTHTADDIFGILLRQDAMLMVDTNAFVIAERHVFPQARHLHLWLVGAHPGHGDDLYAMLPHLEQLARDLHCNRMTGSGRQGWARALEQEGWRPYHHTIAKVIE